MTIKEKYKKLNTKLAYLKALQVYCPGNPKGLFCHPSKHNAKMCNRYCPQQDFNILLTAQGTSGWCVVRVILTTQPQKQGNTFFNERKSVPFYVFVSTCTYTFFTNITHTHTHTHVQHTHTCTHTHTHMPLAHAPTHTHRHLTDLWTWHEEGWFRGVTLHIPNDVTVGCKNSSTAFLFQPQK